MKFSAVTVNSDMDEVVVNKVYPQAVAETTDLWDKLQVLELGQSYLEIDEKSIYYTVYTRVA